MIKVERISFAASGWRAILSIALEAVIPCAIDGPIVLTAIEIAAAIVEASKRFRQPCGFAAFGSDFPFLLPRQNQSESILDALSLIKMVPGKLDYNPIEKLKQKLSKNTQIFVIGPEQVEEYIDLCFAEEKEITTKKLNMEKVL